MIEKFPMVVCTLCVNSLILIETMEDFRDRNVVV